MEANVLFNNIPFNGWNDSISYSILFHFKKCQSQTTKLSSQLTDGLYLTNGDLKNSALGIIFVHLFFKVGFTGL